MSNNQELRIIVEKIEKLKKELRELELQKEELEDPSIENMEFTARARNAMKYKGIERYSQLIQYLQDDPSLSYLRGAGEKTKKEIFSIVMKK